MVLKLWFLIQMAVELGSLLRPQNSISHSLIVLEITISWSWSFIFLANFGPLLSQSLCFSIAVLLTKETGELCLLKPAA